MTIHIHGVKEHTWWDSNPQPLDSKSSARPVELQVYGATRTDLSSHPQWALQADVGFQADLSSSTEGEEFHLDITEAQADLSSHDPKVVSA